LSRAVGREKTEDLLLEFEQLRAGEAGCWCVLVESAAAAGREGESPGRVDRCSALSGVERPGAHRGEQQDWSSGQVPMNKVLAARASMFQQPPMLEAGERYGQVPDLAPGAAEGLLDG
jgi:hypothetical protein